MRQGSRCCRSDSLGCLLCNFSLGGGDGHALAGAHADEIGPELGEGGEEIEEQLCHRIALVVERPAEGQFHASFPKPVGDGAGIWDESCQPVEFRHDERVALAQGGEGQHYRMAGPNLLAAVIHWSASISAKRSDSGNMPGRQSCPSSWPTSHALSGPASWSPANTGGQSADSSLSVRFCPLPDSTRISLSHQ